MVVMTAAAVAPAAADERRRPGGAGVAPAAAAPPAPPPRAGADGVQPRDHDEGHDHPEEPAHDSQPPSSPLRGCAFHFCSSVGPSSKKMTNAARPTIASNMVASRYPAAGLT